MTMILLKLVNVFLGLRVSGDKERIAWTSLKHREAAYTPH